MNPYWETIIEPLLIHLQPRLVVEIGSRAGKNTRLLLDFCRRHQTVLHAIDPAPRFDVECWKHAHGDRFVFHRMLSLEALPTIPPADAILIDGDHNWYTVFHELSMIAHRSSSTGAGFPLTLLHDVDWPYGRRDLYYNPTTIPPEFRHPYDCKGLRLGVPELQEHGGINQWLLNAVPTGTPRNGVLTAVEDFLKATNLDLELILIPGFHGLGILAPIALQAANPDLRRCLCTWKLPAEVSRYIAQLETSRINLRLRLDEQNASGTKPN